MEKLRLYRVDERRKDGLTAKGYFLSSFPMANRGKNTAAEYRHIPRYKVIAETDAGVCVEFVDQDGGRQRAMAILIG